MDELKKISASEVPLHTSKDDCWLVIHGKVYDVTKFQDGHTGGKEVLAHASGTGDATRAFEDVGHSSSARKIMSKYLIGVLEGYDPCKAPRGRKSLKTGGGGGSTGATAAREKSPLGPSDFLLPLFLLGVAIVSWLVVDDNNTA